MGTLYCPAVSRSFNTDLFLHLTVSGTTPRIVTIGDNPGFAMAPSMATGQEAKDFVDDVGQKLGWFRYDPGAGIFFWFNPAKLTMIGFTQGFVEFENQSADGAVQEPVYIP